MPEGNNAKLKNNKAEAVLKVSSMPKFPRLKRTFTKGMDIAMIPAVMGIIISVHISECI
jgi:hypothetical protein